MFRRLMLLNAILLAVLVAGIVRVYHDALTFSATHRVDQIQPESDKPLPKPVDSSGAAPKQDWPDIAAHDPFSFDRNDVPIVATLPAAQQPKRPKPLLYGTLRLGKEPMAMLGTADASSHSSRAVHVGEVFDGWTVAEILEKTVTVKWEQLTESLIMDDPTAQPARIYDKTGASVTAATPRVTVASSAAPPTASTAGADPTPQPPSTVSPAGKKDCLVQTPFGPKTIC